MEKQVYICIDLKSFYASYECAIRHLNPLTTNLVVADESRTNKTICLAISPSLKEYTKAGRARLFEVKRIVKEVNNQRLKENNYQSFINKSYDKIELANHKDYELDFIIAPPQMAKYIEVSTKIYQIYLKYFAKDDIHVYSIDEVFIDASKYLKALNMTGFELAKKIIYDILEQTGITATAGIGTNLFLAKVAMDIVAKHKEADKYGVRIAYLNEELYRKTLWSHKPLTDFWRVGHGIEKRLNKLGLYTMGDICLCSIGKSNEYHNEDLLYKEFGINAELLIDHAWGKESTLMKDIKNYKSKMNSLSIGQVLHCPYDYEKAKIIIKEMFDALALSLVEKKLVTNQISLYIGYDSTIPNSYKGEIGLDHYGKKTPTPSKGGINLNDYLSSSKILINYGLILYEKIAKKDLLIRRVNVGCLTYNEDIIKKRSYEQLNLFTDYSLQKEIDKKENDLKTKEKNISTTILKIKEKYGKNSILKVSSLQDGSTSIERNKQIGGHKA